MPSSGWSKSGEQVRISVPDSSRWYNRRREKPRISPIEGCGRHSVTHRGMAEDGISPGDVRHMRKNAVPAGGSVMADRIRKARYFKVMVPNRAGASAKAFLALAEARVNLLAFSGFPRGGGKAQLDFVPENVAAFKRALRKAGVSVGKGKVVFLVEGPDRPGAGWKVGGKLSQARINITAMHAVVAGGKGDGAILWVKPKDVARTAKSLKAS